MSFKAVYRQGGYYANLPGSKTASVETSIGAKRDNLVIDHCITPKSLAECKTLDFHYFTFEYFYLADILMNIGVLSCLLVPLARHWPIYVV